MSAENEEIFLEGMEDVNEQVLKMQPGSEERARLFKELEGRESLALKATELALDADEKKAQIEYEYEKLQMEEERKMRELDIREKEIKSSEKKTVLETIGTGIKVAGALVFTFFMTGLNMEYDTREAIEDRERGSLVRDAFKHLIK